MMVGGSQPQSETAHKGRHVERKLYPSLRVSLDPKDSTVFSYSTVQMIQLKLAGLDLRKK